MSRGMTACGSRYETETDSHEPPPTTRPNYGARMKGMMMKTYRGCRIYGERGNWSPDGSDDSYDTLAEAKEAIDAGLDRRREREEQAREESDRLDRIYGPAFD